ncbi:MAG: FIST C-terminal domain-containing protein, partial [Myxococcota bacterium]
HLEQDVKRAVASATSAMPRVMDGYPHRTALLFLDPLAGKSEEATALAAELLGQDVTLAGGASGDDLKMNETQLSLGHLVASNAMALVVLYTKTPVGVGVGLGHRVFNASPMRVTRAEGSIVYEVDGRPAWNAWLEAGRGQPVGQDEVAAMAVDDITRFLLSYEGAFRSGNEVRVRSPLRRDPNGALDFFCPIPVGTEICVTEQSADAQMENALQAARMAKAELGGMAVSGALVFDCTCRTITLGNRFDEAVRGISAELGTVPLAGFGTYGEIGGSRAAGPGFHNNATVVLAFGNGA